MWFVVLDDIDAKNGHILPGLVMNQSAFFALVEECQHVKSVAFTTEDDASFYAMSLA